MCSEFVLEAESLYVCKLNGVPIKDMCSAWVCIRGRLLVLLLGIHIQYKEDTIWAEDNYRMHHTE